MNSEDFVGECRKVVDFIINYFDQLPSKKITNTVSVRYLREKMRTKIDQKGKPVSEMLQELEKTIMPGVVHWAHPHFHGYLPSSHSYPSILAEMFASCTGAVGFSWSAGPAMTELEVVMTDWLAQALGLPDQFLNSNDETMGGGIMASSATECALSTILAARLMAINRLRNQPGKQSKDNDAEYLQYLVAYCSSEAHSSVEKAARVAMIQLRILQANEQQQLPPDFLAEAIKADIEKGLEPCYVVATLGTSSSGAFDNVQEIMKVVQQFPGIWLHVNAAYGGNNFICPELRQPLEDIHLADSICVNPYKGLLINADSTVLWVKNRLSYCSALIVDPVYLAHNLSEKFLDHRHWSLWLSRRFRSLKIWFTFRLYGVDGLRNHVRNMLKMARAFAEMVLSDKRFELCNQLLTPLVCFRLCGLDAINQELLARINSRGKMLLTPAVLSNGQDECFVLRLAVGYEGTTIEMMQEAWREVSIAADELLSGENGMSLTEEAFRKLSFTRRVSFMDYRMYKTLPKLREVGELVPVPEAEDEE